MKSFLIILTASLLFFSCQNQSELSKEFNCKKSTIENLETIKDVKNLFSVKFPKHWKTNLFYDNLQSSIYTADTTKQLTETMLLDVTLVKKEISFNDTFKLQKEQESLSKNLIQTKSKELSFLNKPSFYTISKGKKGKFSYQICNIYIKINNQNFIFAKAEVYGDSLVKQRLCKGFNLIEKIKIHQ